MNKICTNIEQSKRLIELGIDRKTSDMYYWCGTSLRIGGYKAQEEDLDIPAWSLSALLELMPTSVYFSLVKDIGGYYREQGLCIGDFKLYNNPLDVVFETVCDLLENKLLNK